MKTTVYIDGQNFLYKVSDVLLKAGLISDKREVSTIDINFLLSNVIKDNFSVKFFGIKNIHKYPELGDETSEKAKAFSDNLRRIKGYLNKIGVQYVGHGALKIRDSDVCKNCGFMDYRYQEKGVDVGLAVSLVRDALTDEVDHIYLLSSDTDLLPAIKIAKENGKEITYVGFDNRLTNAIAKATSTVQVLRDSEIIEAYARSLKS